MKQLLVILLTIVAIMPLKAQQPHVISLVQFWPDNTVTIHIEAGDIDIQPDILSQTWENGLLQCEAVFDCPIYAHDWGNIMLGEANHGCPLTCGHKYSFRVRGTGDMNWSNFLTVTMPVCNSN